MLKGSYTAAGPGVLRKPSIPAACAAAFTIAISSALLSLTGCAEVEPSHDALRAEADAGDAEAQFNLAVSYSNGEDVPHNDQEAARWYRLAAEQGHAEAQFALGLSYQRGAGIPEDEQEAARWFRMAAEQKHAEAQHSLGSAYLRGAGVPYDCQEAIRWYRLAAEQGDALSQGMLGAMYANGEGVPQDNVAAHMWLNLAASQLDGEARKEIVRQRDRVAAGMTRADVMEAQRLARESDAERR